ncbi:prolyl oligopeptidase [Gloeobacter kilaueensis JS1]|uniref:prolyl oligopeptidase n=2 Tax=Gloeobacter TaxID=33071 RepID=U5QNA8_GLOK1|nr:prolyl oligopeptidase [Gloeobacter kilaueensis JS1]
MLMRSALIWALLSATPAVAAPLVSSKAPAPAVAFDETVFRIHISDPYRWMEDPARQQEMVAWVRSQSDAATTALAALPERASFAALLEKSTRAGVRYSDVTSDGGRLFYRRLEPGDRVPKLVVREGGRERVLLDPTAGTNEVAAISSYSLSPDGQTVAVHVAKGGAEVGEVHFLDVATGAPKGVPLGPIWGEFTVAWLGPDTIAYTRITGTDKSADPLQNMRAAILKPGAAGPGTFVLGSRVTGSPPFAAQEFPLILQPVTSDLVLGLGTGARADFRLFVTRAAALSSQKPAWIPVATYDDRIGNVTALGDDLYYLTTKEESNGVVVRRHVNAGSLGTPERIVAGGDLVLTNLEAARDGVYVSAQRDGIAHLLFLPGGRGPAREVALPFEADLSDLRTDADGRSVLFGLNGWTTAVGYYRATGGRIEPVGLQSDSWSGAQGITAVREAAKSADGTSVPMVVLLPSSSKHTAIPTILTGYGSYGILNVSPRYNPYLLAWVAHGGAVAFCGTRGGGERGRSWHEAGRSANKPNAHADFIACAERLESASYTRPGSLVATGASAGGQLVPPAVLKRPDLFAALVPRVAVLNPTRLAAAENGANQFAEAGDPDTAAGFAALAAQDSYLMLATARDIPDTLVTIGLNDRRVAPWMSAKFVALAQKRFGDRRAIWIRADTEAGHGFGSARDRQNAEWADTFAFAWDRAQPTKTTQP